VGPLYLEGQGEDSGIGAIALDRSGIDMGSDFK